MFEANSKAQLNDANLVVDGKGKSKGKPPKGRKVKAPAAERGEPDGRKDSSGIPKAIIYDVLQKRSGELERLLAAKLDAGEAYNAGVKAVAEKSGLLASVVNKFIKARSNDKVKEMQREYEQLTLVFDNLGG